MQSFISNNTEETEEIAARFAEKLSGGEVIAFLGGLGAGKTHFTRGLAKGLGFKGTVTSPTFAIINEYIGGRLPVFHFDMFRVNSWEDLYSTGFFEYAERGGVVAVEWSENIENALPPDTVFIKIEQLSDDKRKITIFKKGEV